MIVIIAILILLLAPLNVLMDWSSEGKFNSDYWNKNDGWWRKYKTIPWTPSNITDKKFTLYRYIPKWYHFGFAPKHAERFPFSTTIFVFLTDGWHLAQFLFYSTWQLIIALTISVNGQEDWYYKLIAFIIIKTMFSVTFELIYRIKK